MGRSFVIILLLLEAALGKPASSDAATTNENKNRYIFFKTTTPSPEQMETTKAANSIPTMAELEARMMAISARSFQKRPDDNEEFHATAMKAAEWNSPAVRDKMKALADIFIKKSAATLGISEADHFATCDRANSPLAFPTEEEVYSCEFSAVPAVKNVPKFNSTDEVLSFIFSHVPKFHECVMKRFVMIKKKMEKLEERAQNYLRYIGESSLTIIAFMSHKTTKEGQQLASESLELMEKTEVLPQASVDSLEKHLCFATSLKIWYAELRLKKVGTRFDFTDFIFDPRQYIVDLFLERGYVM